MEIDPVRKQLLEALNNPIGKQLLEDYFGISEMINLDWSEFRFTVAKYLCANFFIQFTIDDHSVITHLLFYTDINDLILLCSIHNHETCYIKNVVRVIWEFCNGCVATLRIEGEFRKYLLTSGIFTDENIILHSGYGCNVCHYDTFRELVIKGNRPRHAICNGKYPANAELVFMTRTKTYNVREIAKTMPNMKYLSINYKSKKINPIDTVQVLKHKLNDDLPILTNHELQRNVKSANK